MSYKVTISNKYVNFVMYNIDIKKHRRIKQLNVMGSLKRKYQNIKIITL